MSSTTATTTNNVPDEGPSLDPLDAGEQLIEASYLKAYD